MTEQPGKPRTELAPVTLIPVGHQGKLSVPGHEHVPVRVFERGGDVLMLVVLLDADTGFEPEQVEPVLLEYSSLHGLVRLRGQAHVDEPDLIRFSAAEPAEVLQRREFVRIDVAQPVMLTGPHQGEPVRSHAIDVSGGGMLLHGGEDLEPGHRVRFTLELGPGEPPLDGMACVVRELPDGRRGVVFEGISPTERQRLIHFIFDRQRVARAKTRDGARRARRTA